MSKAYKVITKTIPVGERKGETVYTVIPVSYGLLTTDEVARQISTESTATPADVKAVLDRYAYYVKENLKKGYDVELLGFGTLTIRFMIARSVNDPKMATAKMVGSLLPAFRPSYTMHNGSRIYTLIPDKITLVKYGETAAGEVPNTPEDTTGGNGEENPPADGGNDLPDNAGDGEEETPGTGDDGPSFG